MTVKIPALIDCHVHFREPGLTHKATMASEAASAYAGGVHTVCEMPNTVPATTTIAALADKVRRAESAKGQVPGAKMDIRFFFGATEMSHVRALAELLEGSSEEIMRLRAQCCGLKLYFDHSTGNQKASGEVIEEAFELCAKHQFVIVAHCEDAHLNSEARSTKGELQSIEAHSVLRPPESEAKAVEHGIALARKYKTPFHVAHISTVAGVQSVRFAKQEGLPVTCEVTPHHLFLTTDDYAGLGTLAKMNPPLRSRIHQQALWDGIADGTIDCISTDHAPHTLEEKNADDPLQAPSGVPGTETMLPLLLSVVSGHWPHPRSKSQATSDKFQVEDVIRLCFENPNRIFKLGKDPKADQIEVDLDAEWVIRGAELKSQCGWTPFEGWLVKGKIVSL